MGTGQPLLPVPAIGTAPHGYRNWRASTQREQTGISEFALYSDARFVSELRDLGPFDVINTIAGGLEARAGRVTQGLVLRTAFHLPNEMLLDPSNVQRKVTAYHGGWVDDEFAALLSLALGVRCRSGGMTRYYDSARDPLGTPAQFHHRAPYLPPPEFEQVPVIPGIAREVNLTDARELLESYPRVDPAVVGSLVRAARQFQSALWGADDDPSLSWLQLVSALEAAAATLDDNSASPMSTLQANWPELAAILEEAGGDVGDRAAALLAPQVRVLAKIRRLLDTYPPPEPRDRPMHGRIDWAELPVLIGRVYGWRSKALHEGLPIPAPMCQPPYIDDNGIPAENGMGGGFGTADATWRSVDVPMLLHLFASIVGSLLRSWWRDLASGTDRAVDA